MSDLDVIFDIYVNFIVSLDCVDLSHQFDTSKSCINILVAPITSFIHENLKLILINKFYHNVFDFFAKICVNLKKGLNKLTIYKLFSFTWILFFTNLISLLLSKFLKLKFSLLNMTLSESDLSGLKKRQLLIIEMLLFKLFKLDLVLYLVVIFIFFVGVLNLISPTVEFFFSHYCMCTSITNVEITDFYHSFSELLVSAPGDKKTILSYIIYSTYYYVTFTLDHLSSLILTLDLTESFLESEFKIKSINLKNYFYNNYILCLVTQNSILNAISICVKTSDFFAVKLLLLYVATLLIFFFGVFFKKVKSFLSDIYFSNNNLSNRLLCSIDDTLFRLTLTVTTSIVYFFVTQAAWVLYFDESSTDYLAIFYCFSFVNIDMLLSPSFFFLNPSGYLFGFSNWLFLVFNCIILFLVELDLTLVWSHYYLTIDSINWLSSSNYFHERLATGLFESVGSIFVGPWFLKFGYLFLITTLASLFSLTYLGMYGVFLMNLYSLVIFWASSIFFLWKILLTKKIYAVSLGKWFSFNGTYDVKFELLIDYISISFISLTLSIAVFVYIYCFSYFRYEPNVDRLILFINLFVISMVLLVSSGNLIVMYLGWELIGLTSFFLINFWSTKISALKAAFKAFTFNKISDVSILISILLIFSLLNDINIMVINKEIMFYLDSKLNLVGYSTNYIEVISFFLLTAAFIKSAQFGFHIWLPDSMEAPVPASALIHSATLVSAGVFLVLRLSPIFECSYFSYYVIPTVGSVTAAFGGVCAAYQSDIKRILAYSTISHCGFLMVSYSTGYIEYTLLYLYVHGFFKAAVFLCVGNIIRFSRNYQDFKRMGGYYKYLPFECASSFICLMNLSGLPFTLGFFIKHTLILGLPDIFIVLIYSCITIGALSGVVYSFRLFYNVFFDFKKAKKIIYSDASQLSLKSKFYSNTSLASCISILGLITFSYIIIVYIYHLFLGPIHNKSEVNHIVYNVANQLNFYLPTESFKKNIFFINFLVLLVALLVFLVKWRKTYNYAFFLNQFWFFVNVSLYTYLIVCIIT